MNSTVSTTSGAGNATSHVSPPPALHKVKKNYNELQDLLANLPNKLNKVSNQVDKEFLSSYRVHMLSIQTELKNLKHDVTKGEQLLNSDATVAKLEAETKWFADECGRLRQHHDSMFKDCEQMRTRLKGMNEQKIFLSEQLKALMKRNKILQSEIDAATVCDGSISKFSKSSKNSRQQGKQTGRFGRSSHDSISNPSIHEEDSFSRQGGSLRYQGEDEDEEYEFYRKQIEEEELQELEQEKRLASARRKMSNTNEDFDNDEDEHQYHQIRLSESMPNLRSNPLQHSEQFSHTLSPKQQKRRVMGEDRLLQTIQLPPHHLRKSNSSKKLMTQHQLLFGQKKSAGEELDELQSKRSEMELLLEQSLREIFSEITNRKQYASQFSSTRLPSMSTSQKRLEHSRSPSPVHQLQTNSRTKSSSGLGNDDHRLRIEPQIKSQGGITGLGLDQFSDNDRFAALVKFLANPTVFRQVTSLLLERDLYA